MIARASKPMREKTRVDLLKTIQDLKNRLRDQDAQLTRLKGTSPRSPRTRKIQGISRRTATQLESAKHLDWFVALALPTLGAHVGIVIADRDGRIRSLVGDVFSDPTEDLIGKPSEELFVPQDRGRWLNYRKSLDEPYTRPRLSFRVRPEFAEGMVAATFRRPDSDETWILVHSKEQGRERKDADREAVVDPVKRWAGIFAHELNQPLAAVLTTAQACRSLLASGKILPDEMAQGMEALIRRGRHAADVVRRLRTLAGGESPRRVPTDLREVVRRGLDQLQGPLDDSGTKVTLAFDAKLPEVKIDSVQFVQVVVNLVRNAIEATSSLPASRRHLTVRGQFDSREAIVSVEDQGVGLSVDLIQRLFQPLASTKSTGMGLGLALCRQIVEAHGGRIWAKGNVPKGCVFSLSVPFQTEES